MSKKKNNSSFIPLEINPITENQKKAFQAWKDGYHLMLHGYAGTGKTYISLFLACHEMLSNNSSQYIDIHILRSVVASREIGFLPGNIHEKTDIFEDPYRDMCNDIFGRGDAYDLLKTKHHINFATTSYLRGVTFSNTILIVDETQNMSFHELDTIITRTGENTRLIFAGDWRQTDLNKPYDKEGIRDFIAIVRNINSFKHIEFSKDDICRSSLVKEYIIEKEKMKNE
jgi:phosphate starvation-inducible protein PhoH